MRKIGLVCTVLGAAIAISMGVLQGSDWFAAERASAMSERVEWIVSCFWAGLVLLAIGMILLIRSFLHKEEEVTFEDYLPEPAPDGLRCTGCGTVNPAGQPCCLACGAPLLPEGAVSASWECPVCGRVWDDNASICTACGYNRFAD